MPQAMPTEMDWSEVWDPRVLQPLLVHINWPGFLLCFLTIVILIIFRRHAIVDVDGCGCVVVTLPVCVVRGFRSVSVTMGRGGIVATAIGVGWC